MKKRIILGLLLAVVITAAGFSFNTTLAASPWEEIKSAIALIGEQVAQLFTRTDNLTAKDIDLDSQIDNIQLTPGPKGDPGERGPSGMSLKVIDANVKEIGLLVDVRPHLYVWTKDFNTITLLDLQPGSITPELIPLNDPLGPGWESLGFSSQDCSGQAYLKNGDLYTLIDALNYPAGPHTLPAGFYYDPNEELGYMSDVAIQSIKSYSSNQETCVNNPEIFPVAVSLDAVNTNDLFQGPFRIVP